MKTRNITAFALLFVLFLSFMLTGCSKNEGTTEGGSKLVKDRPYVTGGENGWRFDPPITVSIAQFYSPLCRFDEAKGESIKNNVWTQAYEEKLGIKLHFDWVGSSYEAFDTYINNNSATNKLPDILPVYTTLFYRMVEGKKLKNLQQVYDDYADKDVKDAFEGGSGVAFDTCNIDGELLALAPNPEPGPEFLWIRQDWLDKFSLPWPQNPDELKDICYEFVQGNASGKDSTYGLALSNTLGGLSGFANTYGAYSGIWVEKNGKLMRSDIMDEWRIVLKEARSMFLDGVIDPEFAQKADPQIKDDFAAEKLGVYFAGSSAPDGTVNTTVESNKNAVWKHRPPFDKDGKPAKMQAETRVGSFSAVNKNCNYPEALILLINVWADLMQSSDPENQKYHDFVSEDGTHYDSFFYPALGFGGIQGYGFQCQKYVSQALTTNSEKDLAKLNAEQRGYYNRAKPWAESKDPKGWRMYGIFGPGGSVETAAEILKNNDIYYSCGWGPETPTWVKRGPEIAAAISRNFLEIIATPKTVDLDVDKRFDQWVEEYKGLEISNEDGVFSNCTDEINEWWQTKGKETYKKICNTQYYVEW